ncbi:MAG: exo-alpha-sialidase [Acidobacteriia bacterium]|nr:exo-alpha-sialidase [Terriglobia bacterium]
MPTFFTLLFCSLAATPLLAQTPGFRQTNIFEAGQGGYAHYRVPAIIVTPKGTVIAFAEARKSLRGDWGTQDIVMRRSLDGGQNWSAPQVMVRLKEAVKKNPVALAQQLGVEGEVTYNNVVPLIDKPSGQLHVLFCVEYFRCFRITSVDDGMTFTDPVEITATFEKFRPDYDWKVIATGPGHGIQLRNGRLLVPVWLSDGAGGHAHRPSIVSTIYSDDHGKNWQRGAIVVRHPDLKNPSETIAVQLAGGRVALNIRHESPEHRRAISYSRDGSTGWTKPTLHPQLLEPVCMASIIRLSLPSGSAPGRIIFANPHSDEPRDPAKPEGNHKRQNVTVKMSYDEGLTWPVSKSIEPGVSGYSDLAAGPDASIYLIYERGTPNLSDTTIRFLTVARFTSDWLTGSAR